MAKLRAELFKVSTSSFNISFIIVHFNVEPFSSSVERPALLALLASLGSSTTLVTGKFLADMTQQK